MAKKKAVGQKGKKTPVAPGDRGNQYAKGGNTKGTEIGPIREVQSEVIGPANQIEKEQLGPAREIEATQLDATQQAEFRARQTALADQLEAQVRGDGPSVAGLEFQTATDRALKQQMALARSQGGNPALAGRQAMLNQASISRDAAREAAKIRFSEQLAATNTLNQLLGTSRAQDIQFAGSNATLKQQADMANQQAFNQFLLSQGQLNQNADIANQQALNDFLKAQAGLDQQAKLANATAFNNRNNAQGSINAQIRAAGMAANATMGAASAGAAASRYATDAGLYKFNQELAFDMDKYYQGAGQGDINANYNNDVAAINQAAAQRDERNTQLNNFGQTLINYRK